MSEATSVGQIGLDLVINKKKFNKQLSGLEGTAKRTGKKIGAAIAAGLSIKAFASFAKSCLDLGSDLQEVQNVVDVTFPSMAEEVNKFAQAAAASYGLSETMAKKYVGTFGAMAQSFRFTEQEAYNMATSLTALAGDVASFYNISQDEAYTKLKAVFTGETEALNELGIVMTQANLDQFALANGFGKTTAAMTEQEKVALRYQFVLDSLRFASNDFIRTQNSWANQTKILSLQFESLKAAIGQGLINVLTPVLQLINLLMVKLVGLANSFKSFTEMIMGTKSDNSALGNTMKETADAADTAAGATGAISDATKDAAKNAVKAQKALMGFDAINKLSDASSAGGSGAGAAGGSASFADIDLAGAMQKQEDQTNSFFDNVKKRAQELAAIFKEGFYIGIGGNYETSFKNIKGHIKDIKEGFVGIFKDANVTSAANGFIESWVSALGQVTGAITSIGLTIGEKLLGGLDDYLTNNAGFIRTRIIGIFDATGGISEAVGALATTIASIFEVFRSDRSKQITSDVIAIFTNALLGIEQLALQLGEDILKAVVQPFIDNKELIKAEYKSVLEPISKITSTISDAVTTTVETILAVYNSKIKPAILDISAGVSSIMGTIVTVFNEHVAPVLDLLADKLGVLWKKHLQPLVNEIAELFGSLTALVGTFWKNYIAPFINWLIETIASVVMPRIKTLGAVFSDVFGGIADIVTGVIKTFRGLIDFVTAIFANDWKAAWDGIKTIFDGIWETIKSALKLPTIAVTALVSGAVDNVKDWWTECKAGIAEKVSGIAAKISGAVETAKDWWTSAATNLKNKLGEIKKGITAYISTTADNLKTIITDRLKKVGSVSKKFALSISTTASALKTAITNKLKNIGAISKTISLKLTATVSNLKSWINTNIIKPFNKKSPIDIPLLAQGGYVKANTPQLAVIGDNRHQGEVVAPEDKLLEMARMAAAMSTGGTSPEVIELLKSILVAIEALDFEISLDGKTIKKRVVDLINANTKATGVCEIIL